MTKEEKLTIDTPTSISTEELDQQPTLKELDEAKFSWWHVKAVAIASVGFFTDAYDLFITNLTVSMIAFVYLNPGKDKAPPVDDGFMKGSVLFGTLFGQLLFGMLADRKGRSKVYGIELMIIIVGTVAASMSASPIRGMSISAMVSIWRLVMGIGIGGDYPLSATITSEFANKGRRGTMMSAVFSMQGFGQLFGGIVSMITIACFKTSLQHDPNNLDYVWRIIMGVGAIPSIGVLYFRLTMPESPRYAKQLAEKKTATFKEFAAHFGQWKNGKVLLGTAGAWFLLDIAYYGITLNQTYIVNSIGLTKSGDAYTHFMSIAQGNTVAVCMGLLPGYWVATALIDYTGRKPLQMFGFAGLTLFMGLLAVFYDLLKANSPNAFIALYAFALFCFNCGPNTTTFIIPGEVFPTRFRSTCHGISAAAGKAGAIIGTFAFPVVTAEVSYGFRLLLGVFAIVMFLGLLITFLIPESKGMSLEEVCEETTDEGLVTMDSNKGVMLSVWCMKLRAVPGTVTFSEANLQRSFGCMDGNTALSSRSRIMSGTNEQLNTALAGWTNYVLAPRNEKIDNVLKDFQSGVHLISLYEVLSGRSIIRHWNEHPKSEEEQLKNIQLALQRFSNEGIQTTKDDARGILHGDEKTTTKLLVDIAKRYQIGDEEELFRKLTSAGRLHGVEASKQDRSSDAKLLTAVVHHRLNGEMSDKSGLSGFKQAEYISTLAHSELGVPILLDASDISSGAADLFSFLLYLSLILFPSGQKSRQAPEVTGRNVITYSHSQLLPGEYSDEAKDEIASLKRQLALSKESHAREMSDITRQNEANEKSMKAQIADLRSMVEQNSEIDEADAAARREAEAAMQKQMEEYNAQMAKMKQIEDEKKALEIELKEAKERYERDLKRYEEIEGEKSRLAELISDLNSKLGTETEESDALRERLITLTQQQEAVNKESSQIMNRRAEDGKKTKAAEAQIKELEKQKSEAEKKAKKASEAVEKVKKEQEELMKKMKQKLEDENKQKAREKEQAKELKNELSVVQADNRKLRSRRDGYKKKYKSLLEKTGGGKGKDSDSEDEKKKK
ncbi:hypothetical protein PROFUN_05595 [Planoprotostelium fungivorum]|uniref:Major facilitator superfamily (MFS) profile domain-containing protein n=1 Tax=Planoprotostelium fungivorum TaxID=1890364 RepID=A0A2P6N090_9EUKA|nr:hypothetical protein PROFUN_05595 [Planoprotostelium fungivorum]